MHNKFKVTITDEGATYLKNGQMWMYSNNIHGMSDSITNGDVVDIVTTDNQYLGSGYVSLQSHITVRILTKNPNEVIDKEFFKRRIDFAYAYRATIEKDNLDNCRYVFGEADFLPSLVVDRYNDILVTQISSYGFELNKDIIYQSLLEVFAEKIGRAHV